MNNYHYIIGGLPYLSSDFGNQPFSFDTLYSAITNGLSDRDKRLTDWILFGFKNDNLTHHFYLAAEKSKNRFISLYFDFDRKIRNSQVLFTSKMLGKEGSNYIVGDFNPAFEEYPTLLKIFEYSNIFDREQAIDRLKWDKISEITTYNYFDIDVILAYISKGLIIRRWSELDKKEGEILFEKFVGEVRGTFKGI